ncbi:energy transducer TonB [Frateuria hangzhouensis]|uniref:energy transducer TonB n=1 Tax=Frateuria hangzhouensis TaxID=2995589 RepID=UPI002260E92E|nr:energy transducer TonB [Frateuria sp. STR12]MCX7515019.1 energy transducer TonB [Frateuria sp. STR12]
MNPTVRRLAFATLLAAGLPVAAQSLHKVDPQQLNDYWILLNHKVDVDVPNSARNVNQPGCAAVSYMIGSDGLPRDLKVEKVFPEGDFGKIAMSAVSDFHYGPALTNQHHEPVATYYVVPFNAPTDPSGQQKVMAPCQLPGYQS